MKKYICFSATGRPDAADLERLHSFAAEIDRRLMEGQLTTLPAALGQPYGCHCRRQRTHDSPGPLQRTPRSGDTFPVTFRALRSRIVGLWDKKNS